MRKEDWDKIERDHKIRMRPYVNPSLWRDPEGCCSYNDAEHYFMGPVPARPGRHQYGPHCGQCLQYYRETSEGRAAIRQVLLAAGGRSFRCAARPFTIDVMVTGR